MTQGSDLLSQPNPVGLAAVRAIVFDLDGLLVDTEPIFAEVARRVLERRGLTLVPEVLHGMIGTPARHALRVFGAHYALPDTVEDLMAECSELFFIVLGDRPAPLMPGALELMDRLEKKNLPKAIATSSRADYVNKILAPHGILDRFRFVLTADDVVHGKPSPEVYLKAAARFGCSPAQTLVLEDSVNGLKAAKAAGAWCMVVPHALIRKDCLQEADAILGSLTDPGLLMFLGL